MQSIKSQNRGNAVWLELKDDKNVHNGACYWVTFNQNYLFISSWSHGSDNHNTAGMIFSGMPGS